MALFVPTPFYKMNLFKNHFWDENYILLGKTALNTNQKDLVVTCLEKLGVPNRHHWGLPIDWHSNSYVFPKGTLMSTTTSEGILFLSQVYENYPDLIDHQYLIDCAEHLIRSLNKVPIESTSDYLYSYTPMDTYQVFNSNLLVAAAIGIVGALTGEEELKKEAELIYHTCNTYIPKEGFIPYYLFGSEETADSYHQLFSMRAVHYLNQYLNIGGDLLDRIEGYFLSKFKNGAYVVLKPFNSTVDLQPFSEALTYFAITKKEKLYKELVDNLSEFKRGNRYVQRIWIYNQGFKIRSRVCYSRQGYLRLLLALSLREAL